MFLFIISYIFSTYKVKKNRIFFDRIIVKFHLLQYAEFGRIIAQAGSQTIMSHTTAANLPQSDRKADRLVEENPNPPENDRETQTAPASKAFTSVQVLFIFFTLTI